MSMTNEPVSSFEDFERLAKGKKMASPSDAKSAAPAYDNVNKPKHYNREGGMQCIDEMELIFGKEAVKTFCKLNAWKYRYRAADKNGEEDLKKSDWYLAKYKELSAPCSCKCNSDVTQGYAE